MRRFPAALLAFAALVAACMRAARVESEPVAVQERSVTGTVRQVGATPFPRTLIEGEDTVGVTGDYERELARLVGARVRVTGEVASGPLPGPHLRVTSYELLEVDGDMPRLGRLRRDGAGYWLELAGSEPLRLAAVPEGLAMAEGGKVWVVVGGGGAVRRYGIVAEP